MRTYPVLLVVCYFGFPGTLAFPGSTTSGHSFTIAFPKHCQWKQFNKLYMKTMEMRARVTVIYPIALDSVMTRSEELTVKRMQQVFFEFKPKLELEDNGIYKTVQIESDNPIDVMFKTFCDDGDSMTFFYLTPSESLKQIYSVATGIGRPFMLVLTSYLVPRPALVYITFSTMGDPFNIRCYLNRLCITNSTVAIPIPRFESFDDNSFYHPTAAQVASDVPIYVIAGNLMLRVRDDMKIADLVMSPSMSAECWGRHYFIPNFYASRNLLLRASLPNKESINCTIYDINRNVTRITLSYEYESDKLDHAYILVPAAKSHIILETKVAFGLTLLGFKGNTAFMLNLMPRNLWTSEVLYVKMDFDPNEGRLSDQLLLVTDSVKAMLGYGSHRLRWSNIGRSGEVRFGWIKGATTITAYHTDTRARQMLFAFAISKNSSSACQISFYTSSINHAATPCKKSHPVIGDGIDNDCDGRVDEELLNNIDDDADMLVDEDTVQKFRNGRWSDWKTDCVVKCQGFAVRKNYRTCDNPFPSLYGKFCVGLYEQCSTLNGTCPKMCGNKNFSSKCLTECPASCHCNKYGACLTCRRGYFVTRRCTVKCPDGWGGLGCSDFISREIAHKTTYEGDDTSIYFILTITMLPAMVLCGLSSILCLYARPEVRKKFIRC